MYPVYPFIPSSNMFEPGHMLMACLALKRSVTVVQVSLGDTAWYGIAQQWNIHVWNVTWNSLGRNKNWTKNQLLVGSSSHALEKLFSNWIISHEGSGWKSMQVRDFHDFTIVGCGLDPIIPFPWHHYGTQKRRPPHMYSLSNPTSHI